MKEKFEEGRQSKLSNQKAINGQTKTTEEVFEELANAKKHVEKINTKRGLEYMIYQALQYLQYIGDNESEHYKALDAFHFLLQNKEVGNIITYNNEEESDIVDNLANNTTKTNDNYNNNNFDTKDSSLISKIGNKDSFLILLKQCKFFLEYNKKENHVFLGYIRFFEEALQDNSLIEKFYTEKIGFEIKEDIHNNILPKKLNFIQKGIEKFKIKGKIKKLREEVQQPNTRKETELVQKHKVSRIILNELEEDKKDIGRYKYLFTDGRANLYSPKTEKEYDSFKNLETWLEKNNIDKIGISFDNKAFNNPFPGASELKQQEHNSHKIRSWLENIHNKNKKEIINQKIEKIEKEIDEEINKIKSLIQEIEKDITTEEKKEQEKTKKSNKDLEQQIRQLEEQLKNI